MKHSLLSRALCAGLLALIPALSQADVIEIKPDDGKDANIGSGAFADLNFGDNYSLIAPFGGDPEPRSIGLIEFDLGSIPANATIVSATLGIFHGQNIGDGEQYDLFRITSAWDEATVTYNTRPSYDPTVIDSMVISDLSQSTYRNWDVTSLVSDWLDGTYVNYGMWIEEFPIDGGGNARFFSSDVGGIYSNDDPYLKIEYETAVVPVPPALLLFGTGLLGLIWISGRNKAS